MVEGGETSPDEHTPVTVEEGGALLGLQLWAKAELLGMMGEQDPARACLLRPAPRVCSLRGG